MKYLLSGLIGLSLLLGYAPFSRAQTPTPESTAAPSGLHSFPEPKAFTVALAGSVLKYVKGHAKADLQFSWDYLPESRSLRNDRFRRARETRLWKLDQKGFTLASSPSSGASSLPVGTIGTSQEDNLNVIAKDNGESWNQKFNNLWTGQEGGQLTNPKIDKAIRTTILSSRDYFGLLRDHRLLFWLINGNRLRFIVKVGEETRIIEPKDIAWNITQYKFVREIANNPGEGATPVAYYRYTIEANAKTQSFTIPVPDSDVENGTAKIEVPITAEAEWTSANDGLWLADTRLFFTDPTPLSVPTNVTIGSGSENQEAFEERANYFSGVLKYAAGGSLGEVVSQGLFGGGENTSLFAGALISKNDVSQLAGVNFELNPQSSTRAGVMLGFDVGNSNTLFVGPSLSTGALQASVGARVSSDNGDDKLKTKLAGALSVDLSRALGKRKTKTALAVDSAKTGGEWGQASDALFENLELVQLSVIKETQDNLAVPEGEYRLRLTRVKDAQRKDIELDNQDRYDVIVYKRNTPFATRIFLPTGYYEVTITQPGFRKGPTTAPFFSVEKIEGEDGLIPLEIPIVPAPGT